MCKYGVLNNGTFPRKKEVSHILLILCIMPIYLVKWNRLAAYQAVPMFDQTIDGRGWKDNSNKSLGTSAGCPKYVTCIFLNSCRSVLFSGGFLRSSVQECLNK